MTCLSHLSLLARHGSQLTALRTRFAGGRELAASGEASVSGDLCLSAWFDDDGRVVDGLWLLCWEWEEASMGIAARETAQAVSHRGFKYHTSQLPSWVSAALSVHLRISADLEHTQAATFQLA